MLSEGEARARLLLPHDLIFHTEEDEQDFLLLALADAILVERDEHVVQNGDELVILDIHAAVRTDHVLAGIDIRPAGPRGKKLRRSLLGFRNVAIDIAARDHGVLKVGIQQVAGELGDPRLTSKAFEQSCRHDAPPNEQVSTKTSQPWLPGGPCLCCRDRSVQFNKCI